MIRTQIQLEESQYRRLKDLSHADSRSLSDLVRESVGHYLARRETQSPPPLESVAGKYSSSARPSSGELKAHDQHWADAIR